MVLKRSSNTFYTDPMHVLTSRPFQSLTRGLILIVLLACNPILLAQELAFGLGPLHAHQRPEQTYTWQIQYLRPLSEQWALSFTWLNEGHTEDHHRDGYALQMWRFHRMAHNHLRLGMGAGTYRYFDTTGEKSLTGYQNQHGYKTIFSLRAQYPLTVPCDAFVQVNRTMGEGDPQSTGILLGISRQFGTHAPFTPKPLEGHEPKHELTISIGQTVLNSFESQSAQAFAITYRRRLSESMECTMAYSDEGDTKLVDRDGLMLQLWGVTRFEGRGWGVGLGAGPYFSRVRLEKEGEQHAEFKTSLRITMGVFVPFAEYWVARMDWNRTLTHYHRDTDLILAGLGYIW